MEADAKQAPTDAKQAPTEDGKEQEQEPKAKGSVFGGWMADFKDAVNDELEKANVKEEPAPAKKKRGKEPEPAPEPAPEPTDGDSSGKGKKGKTPEAEAEAEEKAGKNVFGSWMAEFEDAVSTEKEKAGVSDKEEQAAPLGRRAKKRAEAAKEAAEAGSGLGGLGADLLNKAQDGLKGASDAAGSAPGVGESKRVLSDAASEFRKSKAGELLGEVADIAFNEVLREQHAQAAPYQSPVDRRREALEKKARREKATIEANAEATGVTVNKSSSFEDQVSKYMENSVVLQRIGDLRVKFEESDTFAARIGRGVLEKIQDTAGGVLEDGEQAAVVAEITRMDPTFDVNVFQQHCERVIIPAVLEAHLAGDTEVLKDWCTDTRFTVWESEIKQRKDAGEVVEFKIIELDEVNLFTAKMIDDDPYLLFTFQAQQVVTVRNRIGEVIEGGEDDLQRGLYLFGVRRNQAELDTQLAWEVVDMQIQQTTSHI